MVRVSEQGVVLDKIEKDVSEADVFIDEAVDELAEAREVDF